MTKMDEESIEHCRQVGIETASKAEGVFELSLMIRDEFSYCSDRWNPGRWHRVQEMIKRLKEMIIEKYAYEAEQYDEVRK